MAFPIIKIDSNDGAASDSACSGAGPATALTGTCHNNNGADGAVLTVSGSLTGVLDTGEHAIYVETPSGRRFARIVGISGSQVTTTNAFPAIASGSPVNYAIGGVRASIGSTSSRLLLEQATSVDGDASAGWVIEFQAGHTESNSTAINVRVPSSAIDGRLTIRGSSTTPAVLTWTADVNGFATQSTSGTTFEWLDMRNSSTVASASAFYLVTHAARDRHLFKSIKIADSADNWYRGISSPAGALSFVAIDCEIAHCADAGIAAGSTTGASTFSRLLGCYIHDNVTEGLSLKVGSVDYSNQIHRCVFYNNGGNGVLINHVSSSNAFGAGLIITNSVFDANGVSGLKFFGDRSIGYCTVIDSILSNNDEYGLHPGTVDGNELMQYGVVLTHCNFYGNTLGNSPTSDVLDSISARECTELNPSYVNAAGGDFTVGNATLLTGGYPTGNIFGSTTVASPSVGAAQSAGGSTFMTFRRRSSPQLRM